MAYVHMLHSSACWIVVSFQIGIQWKFDLGIKTACILGKRVLVFAEKLVILDNPPIELAPHGIRLRWE